MTAREAHRRLDAVEAAVMAAARDRYGTETDDDRRRRFGVLLGIEAPDPDRDATFPWDKARRGMDRSLGLRPAG